MHALHRALDIGQKDRYDCKPSRDHDINDGFDRKMQAVKRWISARASVKQSVSMAIFNLSEVSFTYSELCLRIQKVCAQMVESEK